MACINTESYISRKVRLAKKIEYKDETNLLAKTNSQIGTLKNYNCKKLILNYEKELPYETRIIIKYDDKKCKFEIIKNRSNL